MGEPRPRAWLADPAGADDLACVPPGGPLARSWSVTRSYRYDQIWATKELRSGAMRYLSRPELSDHALVTVTIEVS